MTDRPNEQIVIGTTATSMKTSLKNRLHILSLFFTIVSQVAQFKRSETRLELKRRDRARGQSEMVEFIAFPFPFSNKLKIWSFRSGRGWAGRAKKFTEKRAELLFAGYCFFDVPRLRRRRSFVRSLIFIKWRRIIFPMGPYQPTVFVFLSMFLVLKHPDRLKHDLKSRNLEKRTESIWVW